MSTIFSLHIGIDQYHPQSHVPNLGGCVNDVKSMLQFLQEIYPAEKIKSKTLFNEEATYQNIIDHFGEQHLSNAQPNDVVLIQYAGHGSQANAADAFTRYFPDQKDETWVCYDSRKEDGLDLADKELSVLIDRIASKNIHVVVIMDCCHSGSGTRDVNIKFRQHSTRIDPRPLESYLNGYFSTKFPNDAKVILPNPKHVLLAACDPKEKAGEINGNGLFTSSLIKVLKETNGGISYANLFSKVQIELAKQTGHQHPQFEPYGFFNVQSGFLQESTIDTQHSWQLTNVGGKWVVKKGIIHGLSMEPGKQATFKIYENGVFKGHAKTKIVLVEESIVSVDCELNTNSIYDCQMISFPANRYPIELSTSEKGKQQLEKVLEKYNPLFFELHPNINSKYKFEICDDELLITESSDQTLLRQITGQDANQMFQDAFEWLEILGRREKMLKIENQHRKIAEDSIEIQIALLNQNDVVEEQKTGEEVQISIPVVDGNEQAVPFLVSLKNNHSNRELYCSLLYFSENFDIKNLYNGKIPANKTAIAIGRDENEEAPFFLLNGKPKSIDTFKLFVSTRPLSTYLLEMQNNLKLGESVNYAITRSTRSGVSDIATRAISNLKPEEKENFTDDWFCKTMEIISTPKIQAAGSSDNEMVETNEIETAPPPMSVSEMLSNEENSHSTQPTIKTLTSKIKVLPHNSFKADFKLSSLQPSRYVNDIYTILQKEENKDLSLFSFEEENTRNTASTRSGGDSGIGNRIEVLEINNFQDDKVLKEDPLKIQIKSDSHDSLIVPFVFDGEHIVPVGTSENDGQGNINVEINELPLPKEIAQEREKAITRGGVRKRSLAKAIKLYFVKTFLGKNNATALKWVDFENGKAQRKSGRIMAKVGEAQNIVLLIHGIIGDTKPFLSSIKKAVDNGTADLILTFDYENLNTPIEKTASFLKQQLNHVGINEDSNKKITIVAHSMGGLVSRYFIENLNGQSMVNRLIMAGTPNMGSKIADLTTYRKWATTIFTLAANSGFGIPAAATILSVLNYTKNLTVTLEQMKSTDELVVGLQLTNDPGVPYHIIAGDFDQYCKTCTEKEQRLIDKIYKASSMLFYKNEDHDIAVSVNSIEGVNQSRFPKPTVEYVACHHLNYFSVEESLNKIIHWIGFEDPMATRVRG